MQQFLFVGLGGFLGANARYIISSWFAGSSFPLGTLFVNVTGSFLLAVFSVWFTKQVNMPENIRLMIGTGFFGAYTTFSTYSNESINLIRVGNWQAGFANIIANNILCLIGVVIGLWVASKL